MLLKTVGYRSENHMDYGANQKASDSNLTANYTYPLCKTNSNHHDSSRNHGIVQGVSRVCKDSLILPHNEVAFPA